MAARGSRSRVQRNSPGSSRARGPERAVPASEHQLWPAHPRLRGHHGKQEGALLSFCKPINRARDSGGQDDAAAWGAECPHSCMFVRHRHPLTLGTTGSKTENLGGLGVDREQ